MSINLFSQCENDITPPYFVNFEPEITISCDVDLSVIFPVALDECDDSVEIAWYEEITPGFCENNYDVVRVYRAFDDIGNQAVESQIIHVVDETSPLFTPFEARTVDCSDSIVFDDPQVTDNCSDFTLTSYDIITQIDSCTTNYMRVWQAIDFCGNTSILSQTITSQDLTAPVITGQIYLEFSDSVNIDSIFITVTDNCSVPVISYSDIETSGNNIIRTYMATDYCGNTSTFEQIIHIDIVIPPGDDDEDDEDEDDDDDEDEDDDEDDEDEDDDDDEDEDDDEDDDDEDEDDDDCDDDDGDDDDEDEDDDDGDDDDDEDEDDDDGDEDDDEDDDSNKVAICHCTGNGDCHTIYVAPQAVPAHLVHGDYLGPCTEMIIDWQSILPNSDLQMRVIKGKDNKYKKFVKVQ